MGTRTPKVFGLGLGLSRTGTSSLGESLNQLGIKNIYYPCDSVTQRELEEDSAVQSILSDVRRSFCCTINAQLPAG